MGALLGVVYVSRAARPLDAEALSALLEVARANNERDGITGMLLYAADTRELLQVLEGPAETVGSLMERILVDPRHEDIRVLRESAQSGRAFDGWEMAFKLFEGSDGAWPDESLRSLDAEAAMERARAILESVAVELRAS